MKAIVQRVRRGRVAVLGKTHAEIDAGFVILIGVTHGDTRDEARWLAAKCAHLRVFEDDHGKMNRSLLEVGGSALVVSQFTLYADPHKGRRPSFVAAAPPEVAKPLVTAFAESLALEGVPTQTGAFGAEMLVEIENDGPVTILLERQPSGGMVEAPGL